MWAPPVSLTGCHTGTASGFGTCFLEVFPPLNILTAYFKVHLNQLRIANYISCLTEYSLDADFLDSARS